MERNSTPWNRLGSRPECHCRLAIGWRCPNRPVLTITTNPGRFWASVPSPYHSQLPAAGRPEIIEPVFMNVWAGSWLIASVCIERTIAIRSAIRAETSGKIRLISWPLCPVRLKACCGAMQVSAWP